jgi:hypothetical protein
MIFLCHSDYELRKIYRIFFFTVYPEQTVHRRKKIYYCSVACKNNCVGGWSDVEGGGGRGGRGGRVMGHVFKTHLICRCKPSR